MGARGQGQGQGHTDKDRDRQTDRQGQGLYVHTARTAEFVSDTCICTYVQTRAILTMGCDDVKLQY